MFKTKNLFFFLTISLFITGCNNHPAGSADQAKTDSTDISDSALIKAGTNMKDSLSVNDTIATPTHVALTVVVTDLKSADAPVVVGLYGEKNKFLDVKDQMKLYTLKPKNGKLVADITDLEYGTYAMAIFQDLNSDGVIGKNKIGIPTEPYAFSNNYKPIIKAPNFKDCKFDYTAEKEKDTVVMALLK